MISHLALIMDGNRRWAKKRALMPWLGHRQGVESVEMAIQYCLDHKIPYLSLYTFSLENFKRSQQEISYLFSLVQEAKDRIVEFVNSGVQIRFIGDCARMPQDTRLVCEEIEQETASGSLLQCNFLMCYGGQQEIMHAVESFMKLGFLEFSIDSFRKCLWLGDIPDPEIIIRTGGVKRLSNFLLFQGAYSEIRFLDCLWPDLTREILHQTVIDCIQAEKNIGK